MSMTTDVKGRQLSIIDTYQINLSDEEQDLTDFHLLLPPGPDSLRKNLPRDDELLSYSTDLSIHGTFINRRHLSDQSLKRIY